jgi:ElaB/YqjD/DUF883 family membrane-anchored ribosome-binding protein
MAIQFFNHSKKISEALEGLKEARETVEGAYKTGQKRAVKAVKSVDKELHRNPWIYVGAAAAAALLVGFFAGRSSKKEKWER